MNVWSCTKDKCFHYRSILWISKGSTIIHITLFRASRFFLLILFHLSFYIASSSTMLKTILFTENDFYINFIAKYYTKQALKKISVEKEHFTDIMRRKLPVSTCSSYDGRFPLITPYSQLWRQAMQAKWQEVNRIHGPFQGLVHAFLLLNSYCM